MNEYLQKALEKRQIQEKEKLTSSTQSSFYNDVEYCVLGEKGKVVRIIGKPVEIRENPWDPKYVLESQILRDDKKGYIKVRWPYKEINGRIVPDPEWILTKLYNKVNEGFWMPYKDGHVNEKGKTGEWVKKFENNQSYKRVMGNSKEGELFPKRFYPSLRVVMQVIDRHDDYCKKNKKCKILISKSTPYVFTDNTGVEKTIYYRETGIPKTAYDLIFEHFSQIGIFWEDTDAIIIRKASQKTYVVWDKMDRYLTEQERNLAIDTPLTEEEKNYAKYDLDEMYKITSYATLKKYLSGLFKLVDSELSTDFYEMLLVLVEKEAQSKQNNLISEKDTENIPFKEANKNVISLISDKDLDKELENNSTEKQKNLKIHSQFDDVVLRETFPYIDKLSLKEKEILINAISNIENNVPMYKFSVEECYCVNRKCYFIGSTIATSYPIELSICPVCGSSY